MNRTCRIEAEVVGRKSAYIRFSRVIAAPPSHIDPLEDEMRVWVGGRRAGGREISRAYDPNTAAPGGTTYLLTEDGDGFVTEGLEDLMLEAW